MNNLEKMNKMVESDPELQEKLEAEVRRLAKSKEAANPEEALIMAVKTVMGIDLLDTGTDTDAGESTKMDLEELDEVSGGNIEHRYNNHEDANKQVMNVYVGKFPTLLGLWHDSMVDTVNAFNNKLDQVLGWFGIG